MRARLVLVFQDLFFEKLLEISAVEIKVSFEYREKFYFVKHDQEKILVIRAIKSHKSKFFRPFSLSIENLQYTT